LRKKFVHSVAVDLFHEWSGCCSILSTPPPLNPALETSLSSKKREGKRKKERRGEKEGKVKGKKKLEGKRSSSQFTFLVLLHC